MFVVQISKNRKVSVDFAKDTGINEGGYIATVYEWLNGYNGKEIDRFIVDSGLVKNASNPLIAAMKYANSYVKENIN